MKRDYKTYGIALLFLPFLMVIVTSCGGGSGSSSGTQAGHVPSISNLLYTPSSAFFNQGNGTVDITGTIDFIDAGGDVTAARFTSSAGANLTLPIAGMSGQTSGTIQGSFTVTDNTVGDFTFEIWLVDAAGSSSNHLTGTFSVRYDDSATHWTQRSSGTTANLRRVVWSGTKYVAAGDAGTIITSSDGKSWTQRTSGTNNGLRGIAWSGTKFVAVGAQGTILTSPDGNVWSAQNSGCSNNLISVVWSGSQFVVTGGSSSISSDAPLLTSPDGISWTLKTSGLNGWDLWNIAWSGSRFIVVGSAQFNPAPNVILTSLDGTTWSQQDIIVGSSQYLFDIQWADSKFVAVGPPSFVATSVDGLTWQSPSSSNMGLLYAIAWSGNQFVAVGWDINTSPDGAIWTRLGPYSYPTLWGIVWGGNQYVAVGDSGLVITSP
jgi:hypothetical protein